MALIKCLECGQLVSDKATICPKCGAPIEKKIFCEECGTEMSASAETCPSCGFRRAKSFQASGQTINVNLSGGGGNVSGGEIAGQGKPAGSREARMQRFLMDNKRKFPQSKYNEICDMLNALDDVRFGSVEFMVFKDPTLMLVISIFLGEFGVDRFMLNQVMYGVLKLLLTLCCGIGTIWWIIDIFLINKKTLEYNYELLRNQLMDV